MNLTSKKSKKKHVTSLSEGSFNTLFDELPYEYDGSDIEELNYTYAQRRFDSLIAD